ncbi:MAG: class I SAM-dependent methyltransferase [Candidatus Bathyarchaeia archaeon]
MSLREMKNYYEREAEVLEDHQRQMYFGSPWSQYWHGTRLQHILRITRNIKFRSFLDVGCAEGYYIKIIAGKQSGSMAVGLDIAKKYLLKAKKNARGSSLVLGDAHHLPFKDNAFDLILCSETLEHVIDQEGVLRELLRVSCNYVLLTVAGENLPHLIARRLGLIKQKDPYSEAGLGHIHEIKISKFIPLALKVGYKIEKMVLTCYFPPTFPEKHRMPTTFIKVMKIFDEILNKIPVIREYAMVQIALLKKREHQVS